MDAQQAHSPNKEAIQNAEISLSSFGNSLKNLEIKSGAIEKEIEKRDKELSSKKESFTKDIEKLSHKSQKISKKMKEMDSAIKHTVNRLRHFAKSSDMKELKEKMKEINIDELITERELARLIREKYK